MKLLITGDYGHNDFQWLLKGPQTVTLMPLEQASNANDRFDLIVLAQSIPGQFRQQEIESLQVRFPLTPIVALLGSWCEGEVRTGRPFPGVQRIYWHQWQGRFDAFCQEMESLGVSGWHVPWTSTPGDQLLRVDQPHPVLTSKLRFVGVSAANFMQFQPLKEAIDRLGYRSLWIETTTPHQQANKRFQPICIDSEGIDNTTLARVDWFRQHYPRSELILITSFPRIEQLDLVKNLGVRQIVSKPFTLSDLAFALERATVGTSA